MKHIALLSALCLLFSAACSTDSGGDTTPASDTAAADAGADTATGADATTAADSAAAADTATAPDVAAATDAGAAADSASAADASPAFDWESMSFLKRRKYMEETVEPTMKKIFQEFDPKVFANFNCATCHGPDAQKNKFKMPSNPVSLDPKNMPDPNGKNAYMAKYAKFMMGKVTPEMLKLLNVEGLDPSTGQGFDCFSCHTTKK